MACGCARTIPFALGEIDLLRGNVRQMFEHIEKLEQFAEASPAILDEMTFEIVVGQLFDAWAAGYPELALDPLRALQGKVATERQVYKVWSELMISYQHLEKIEKLALHCCTPQPKPEPIDYFEIDDEEVRP